MHAPLAKEAAAVSVAVVAATAVAVVVYSLLRMMTTATPAMMDRQITR